MAVRYESPGVAELHRRLQRAEAEIRRQGQLLGGAFLIGSQQRSGITGAPLAGGKPLWDSFGLIQTLQLAASINSISGSTSATSFTQVASTTVSVPTGRNQNFLCLLNLTLQASAGGGTQTTARARLNFNGQLSGQINLLTVNASPVPYYTLTTFLTALNIATGTYTIKVEAMVDLNTSTLNITDGTMNALLMGG